MQSLHFNFKMKYLSALALAILLFSLPTFSQERWERTYGGTGYDVAHAVQQTQDRGYIVAGTTNCYGNSYQVYLLKTDASGDTLWTRTYGGTDHDYGYAVQQTTDGGYIVSGQTNSFGDSTQVYLIKTNASGDTLWTRTYGGTGTDGGYSVQQTRDTGYIVAGWTSSFGNYYQVYLLKTNAFGDTLWTKTYGGTSRDESRSAQQTQDGGYIVAGWTMSFGNSIQVYLIKINASGDTLWTKTYGGAGGDYGEAVQQTSDTGYLVAGYATSFGDSTQVYLIKTNASGDTLWTRTYGGTGDDRSYFFQQTSDEGCIVTGRTYSFGNYCQIYLIKTDANGNVGTERGRGFEEPKVQGIKITPNPFASFASIPGHEAERFSLFDISGRKVGTYQGDRVGKGLGAGVYFLRRDTACRAPTTAPVRIVKLR